MDTSEEQTGTINNTSSSQYFINNTGDFVLTNGKLISTTSYIYNSNGTITINGGKIDIRRTSNIINSKNGKIVINGGELYSANMSSSTSIDGTKVEIHGGIVEQNAQGFWRAGNITGNGELLITGGELKTSGTSADAEDYTISGNIKTTITGGKVINEKGNTISTGSQPLTITDGEIVSTRYSAIITNGNGTINISGGNLKGSKGITINKAALNITGGKVEGDTYGIETSGGTTTIGIDDGTIDIEKPEVVGGTYGLYINSGTVKFNDGILKGKTASYYGALNSIATNAILFNSEQEEEGITLSTTYLVTEHDFIKNGDKLYKKIETAISESSNGDVLVFIDNGQSYNQITVPEDKKIIIDLNGYTLNTNNGIINNGDLTIKNSDREEVGITAQISGYLITNNPGAKLRIDKTKLQSKYVIDNKSGAILITNNSNIVSSKVSVNNAGTFTGNGDTIVSDENAINNQGIMNLDTMEISGVKYGIYLNTSSDNSIINSNDYFRTSPNLKGGLNNGQIWMKYL